MLRAIYHWMAAFGFDGRRAWYSLRGLPHFVADALKIRRTAPAEWPVRLNFPCLNDRYEPAGTMSGHYFNQDLFVARKIFERSPGSHIDVGSRIDGFVAHVASFRPIKVIDIRPLVSRVPQIEFVQANVADPNLEPITAPSVSCLHALEHFGLGRYGDDVDIDAWRVGFGNLRKMVEPGGLLYLAVPIGAQRIEYNAHRVFAPATILKEASPLALDEFAYVDDDGDLHEIAADPAAICSFADSLQYGLGLFTFRQPA